MAAPDERWEYLARELRLRDPVSRDLRLNALAAECNELGAEGWELAGIAPSETGKAGVLTVPTVHLVLIFKRPVRAPAAGSSVGC